MKSLILLVMVPLVAMLAGCAAPGERQPSFAMLTGTVTYRQRIALPQDAVVELKLVDVSRSGAPSVLLAVQTLPTQGKQVPIPFEMVYDETQIDQRMTYALQAQITVGGALRWATTGRVKVITQGAPTHDVEVVVAPVR